MGLFSSKKKTTYYSNHIAMVKMDKQFKPYINSIVMSTALNTDRYTSAADIIKDGMLNSPKQAMRRLFKYQAKQLGREGELYAPSSDFGNFNFRPYFDLAIYEEYEISSLEIGYLEPDYYVMEWVIKNRPELLVFKDRFETEYNDDTKVVLLEVNNEIIPIKISNPSTSTQTLYVEYKVYDTRDKQFNKEDIQSSEIVKSFDYSEKGYSLESSNKTTSTINVLKEVAVYDTIGNTREEYSKVVTSTEMVKNYREDTYINREVSEEDYANNIVGYKTVIREITKYREEVVEVKGTRYRTGSYLKDKNNSIFHNSGGRFMRIPITTVTTTQVPYKEIILTRYNIVSTNRDAGKIDIFIYPLGSGSSELDSMLTTKRSLGFKLNPLIVKIHERLVSPNWYTDSYNFNDGCIKKFSSNTSNYKQMYDNFAKDGLSDIKESILIYGVDLNHNAQFALQYGYTFFNHIFNFYSKNEGTVDASGICNQSAGMLYYMPRISATKKNFTGVPTQGTHIGKIYSTRSGNSITYIKRTSAVTYTTIRVTVSNLSVSSAKHWISHHISAPSGGNTGAGTLLPILDSVVNQLPVKYVADIAKYSPTLLLTTFETVKIKWYQRSIFKIVIAVIVIAISIFFPPAGAGAAAVAGTVGATIAAYMSLTGLAYIVVANAVNMVIGMVIAKLVSAVVNKFVDGALGQILGAVISVALISGINGVSSGEGFMTNFGSSITEMFSIEKLMNLSNLTKVMDYSLSKNLNDRMNKLEEQKKTIEDLQSQLLGVQDKMDELTGNSSILSTGHLLDSIGANDNPSDIMGNAESPNTFLHRAVLKGSDVVDMSLSVIYDYVDMELEKKNYIVKSVT